MFKDKKSPTSINASEHARKCAAIIVCDSLCVLPYDFLSSLLFVCLSVRFI